MKARWLKMPVNLLGQFLELTVRKMGHLHQRFHCRHQAYAEFGVSPLASTDRRWSGTVIHLTHNETGQRIADQTLVPVRGLLPKYGRRW